MSTKTEKTYYSRPGAILKLASVAAVGTLLLSVMADGVGLGLGVARVHDDKQQGWKISAEAKKEKNPIASNPASVAKGKATYDKHCASCHGATGDGKTKMAEKLTPKPPDMTKKKEMSLHSDGELFAMITMGKGKMPSYEKKLTKDERWQTVNYLKTLAK